MILPWFIRKSVAWLGPMVRKRKSMGVGSRNHLLGVGALRLFLGSLAFPTQILGTLLWSGVKCLYYLVFGKFGKRRGQPPCWARCQFSDNHPDDDPKTSSCNSDPFPLIWKTPRKTPTIHSLPLLHIVWAVVPPTNRFYTLSVLRFLNLSGPLMLLSLPALLWIYCFKICLFCHC